MDATRASLIFWHLVALQSIRRFVPVMFTVHTRLRARTHMHACTRLHAHTHTHGHTRTRAHLRTHTRLRTHTHAYAPTYGRACSSLSFNEKKISCLLNTQCLGFMPVQIRVTCCDHSHFRPL